MTTIAAFATFTQRNDATQKTLNSVYVLSDSQWTWNSGNENNVQKIFYSKEGKFVAAYCGDAQVGLKVCSQLCSRADTDSGVRFSKAIQQKSDKIKEIANNILAGIPHQSRAHNLAVFVVTYFDGILYAFELSATTTDVHFFGRDVRVGFGHCFYTTGSGVSAFEQELDKNCAKNPDVMKGAICFYSFINFLRRRVDPQSALPAQAVSISVDGRVKPISIKIDGEFFKLGNIDRDRVAFKYEVDYRDEEFEFLHFDGNIKGRNRKRYRISK